MSVSRNIYMHYVDICHAGVPKVWQKKPQAFDLYESVIG